MLWYDYLAHFVAGAFLANGVPHFVQCICGNKFQTPFARPRGVGASSALANVIWGWFNFIIGGVLLRLSFPPLPPPPALSLATMLGVLVTSVASIRAGAQQRPASIRNRMLVRRARIVAFLIFGLSGGADANQEGKDMKLEDMGFVMRAADTPAQIDRLRQLPPRTFVARTKGGRRYYLYADPDYCKCVFVGDELAMKNYRDLVSPPPQAPMSIGPGKPSVASEMIQEMDPVLGGTIYDGDILDW